MIKIIYLKSALECNPFDVAIDIKIPCFRVLVTIEPGHSLFVTTNCLRSSRKAMLIGLPNYFGSISSSISPGVDSMINEFLKYGGSEVRNKLMKIMNMIFEKGEVPNDFRKTLIKPLYKKGDKS